MREYSLNEREFREMKKHFVSTKMGERKVLYFRDQIEAYFLESAFIPEKKEVKKSPRGPNKEETKMAKWKRGNNGHFYLKDGNMTVWERHGKNGETFYQLDYRGNGRRSTLSLKKYANEEVKDRQEAYEIATRMRAKLDLGEFVKKTTDEDAVTFADLIPIYLKELERKEARSMKSAEGGLRNRLAPFFGSMKLKEISLREIECYVDKLKREGRNGKPIGDSAIITELAWAKALFNVAVKRGYGEKANPFNMKELGLKTNMRNRYMTYEEQERLWPVLEKYLLLKDLAVVELNSGMRPKNIINLRKTQVRLEERQIFIPKEEFKSKKDAYFGINDTVLEILKRRMAENPDSEYVFVRENGKRVTHRWYQKKWKEACAEAKVEDLRFYELKHTLGTRMASNGKSAFQIKNVMNHSQLSSTDRYVKNVPEANVEALKEMSEALNIR